MKKNKMMRIASVLLIVTILSTCAISGTFAKYVTRGTGEGDARVAKWGINIAMEGDDLFASEYAYSTNDHVSGGKAVKAAVSTDKVVAPGTNSTEAGGNFAAVISGTPEVAVRYSLAFDEFEDIVLHVGDTIKNETVLASTWDDKGTVDTSDDEFTYEDYDVTSEYSPVKFTIKFIGNIGGAPANSNGGNNDHTGEYVFPAMSLTDWDNYVQSGDEIPAISYNGVKAYAADGALNFDVPAGKSIEGKFVCTWEWVFEAEDNQNLGISTTDGDIMDTYLGNHIEDYPLSFSFTATAVQID